MIISIVKILPVFLLSLLSLSCTTLDGYYDPGFNRTKFNVDYNQHEITVKSKYGGWGIIGLDLDGNVLNFFLSPYNAKDMVLNGIALKIEYTLERKDPETGIISYMDDPKKISSDYFEIIKPSYRKLQVKLAENTTGEAREIIIHAGDGNSYTKLYIKQDAKPGL